MFVALKRGFRSMASLILVRNVVGELRPKRTLAASRGFLAAARLSCLTWHFKKKRKKSLFGFRKKRKKRILELCYRPIHSVVTRTYLVTNYTTHSITAILRIHV